MNDFTYAIFDENGNCKTITSSSVDLELEHLVPKGTMPDDIYLNDGEITVRENITISIDREYYQCDGKDRLVINGLPKDAILSVGDELTSKLPGARYIQTVGKYRSNTISVVFTSVEDITQMFIDRIDVAAGKAREQHMTLIPGQQMIYQKKEAEARDWLAGLPGKYPFLNAEAAGCNLGDLARSIIARADETEAALASIEGLRMNAKTAILAATDVASVVAADNIKWS